MQSILLAIGGILLILVSVAWAIRVILIRDGDRLGWQPPEWALKFLTLSGNRGAWNARLRVVNFMFGVLGVIAGALLISHA
jgi:hypothetical protein